MIMIMIIIIIIIIGHQVLFLLNNKGVIKE